MSRLLSILKTSAATLIGGALLATSATAQESAPDAPENEIIVDGYSEKEVRNFLWRSLAQSGDSIARRTGPVCVGIDNIHPSISGPVSSRIKANLSQAGVEIGEAGCAVNAAVVFHHEPHQFVTSLKESHPRAFRTMYKPEARRLTKPGRPVYSWMFIPTEYRQLATGIGEFLPLGPSFDAAQTSRIRQEAPQGIAKSFTVVDIDKLDGMTATQLADFLTLQIMIEFRPGALETAPTDSILNLFYAGDAEFDAPAQMSSLDREMLAQLYDRRQNLLSAGALRNRIAINMISNLDKDGLIKN